jgi:riboflavin kinase/FMN adenylyltransferase
VRAVFLGADFRFGHRAAGGVALLRTMGAELGFAVETVEPVKRRGLIVSSTEIRRRIIRGQVAAAARLLGRFYSLEGRVVPGEGVGTRQTVPTLNMETDNEVLPGRGVYVTRTTDCDMTRCWPSITNVGYRPTFGGDRLTIETFLLSGLDDRTPARIRVEFTHHLRDERRFDSPEELKAQIMRDVARAQTWHRRFGKLQTKTAP